MARDCSSSTRKTENSKNRIARRSYLKLAGTTAISMAGMQAVGSVAAAKDYETIKVPAGGRKLFQIGSGETLENILIDCTAPNADARIIASGSDWTIRNIGFKGQLDHDGSDGYPNHIAATGNGRIENVFVGNGVTGPTRKGGIGVGASHSGHIDIVRTHIAGWSDNGIYAAGMARPGSSGGHGTLTFDHCYCHDNNIASLRIASGGTKVKNTVIHNSNSTPKVSTCDCVNARGVYDGYGTEEDVVEFENVDIDCTENNTEGGTSALVASKTTFRIRNSQVKGRLDGNIETTNVGNKPKNTPPKGVPMTAEQAAQGIGAEKPQSKSPGKKKSSKKSSLRNTQSTKRKSSKKEVSKTPETKIKSVKKTQKKRVAGNTNKACFTSNQGKTYCIDWQRLRQIISQYI